MQISKVKDAQTNKNPPETNANNEAHLVNDVSHSDDHVKQLEYLKPLSAFFFFMKQVVFLFLNAWFPEFNQ